MLYVMEYHKKLLEAKRDKRVGNHNVEFGMGISRPTRKRYFYYHGNCVCIVDDIDKTFELNDCGWGGSRSTKLCLAGYRTLLTSQGYKEIDPKPIFNYEYKNKM